MALVRVIESDERTSGIPFGESGMRQGYAQLMHDVSTYKHKIFAGSYQADINWVMPGTQAGTRNLLMGDQVGTLSWATLIASTGISITYAGGQISFTATGGVAPAAHASTHYEGGADPLTGNIDLSAGYIKTLNGYYIGAIQIVDASRNLVNIGTITSGLINGQTISSTANFTGTVAAAGNVTITGVSSKLVAPRMTANSVAAGIKVGNSYATFLQNEVTPSRNFILGHNVYAEHDASENATYKWVTTHATFGSRMIELGYPAIGIRFFADNAATTAGGTATRTLRFIISNTGTITAGSVAGTGLLPVYVGNLFIGSTEVINASRNLLNIGTITSGLINSQTISSAANFTGTLNVTGALTTEDDIKLNDASRADFYMTRTAVPTSGENLAILFGGAYRTGTTTQYSNTIRTVATENWSATAAGSKWEFYTTPNTSISDALAVTIGQDRSLTVIGAGTFGGQLNLSYVNPDYLAIGITATTVTNAAGIQFVNTGRFFVGRDNSVSNRVTGSGNAYDSYVWVESNTPLLFGTNNSLAMTIEASHNVSLAGNFLPATTDAYDIGSYTKLWSSSYISTMNALIFAENVIQIVGGRMKLGKNQGKLPAVSSADTTIDFGQAMIVGDFIEIRSHDTGGTIKAEYILIGTLVSGTTYNVTRDLASAHVTDPAWADGTPYFVLGQTGTGRIEFDAESTPRISMLIQGATYNATTERLRAGDLNGNWGYVTETYGFAVGAYTASNSWVTIDPTNGVRIGNNTTTLGQWATDGSLVIGEVAVSKSNISISSGQVDWRINTSVYTSLTTAGVLTLGLVSGGEYMTLDGTNGIRIYGGGNLAFSVANTGILTLQSQSSGQYVSITSNELLFYIADILRAGIQADVYSGIPGLGVVNGIIISNMAGSNSPGFFANMSSVTGTSATGFYAAGITSSGGTGTRTFYGIRGQLQISNSSGTGSVENRSVYGTASAGDINWAGYFDSGNVYIANTLYLGADVTLYRLSANILKTDDVFYAGGGSIQIINATNPYLRLSKTDATARNWDIQISSDHLTITDATSVVNALILDKITGNATFSGSLQTADPGTGAGKWKLGTVGGGAAPTLTANSLKVEVDGTDYEIGLITRT